MRLRQIQVKAQQIYQTQVTLSEVVDAIVNDLDNAEVQDIM